MKTAVIGGTGGMGKSMIQLLHLAGMHAVAVGRKTLNSQKIITESDVMIISVPSSALSYAVNLLSSVDLKNKLIVSLGSCMLNDEQALKSIKAPLLHVHQMFGPKVFPFKGKNIILAGAIKNSFAKVLSKNFKTQGMNVSIMTIQQHDKLMASVQATSQFSAIALGMTLAQSGNSKKVMEKVSSLTFKLNSELLERITMQKAELWAYLQFENKFADKQLENYLKNVEKLRKIVKNKDYKVFEKEFNKISSYWQNNQ